MGTTDPRIDDYIAKAPLFAQPILQHIRQLVHTHCPEANETIKWSMPHFEYKGSIFCRFAAFKQHCSFGFWLGSAMNLDGKIEEAMGQFGRITSIEDLPKEKAFAKLIKESMKLHDAGTKGPMHNRAKNTNKELEVPETFLAEVRKNPTAWATFEGFSYSNKKDYVEWYTEAKTEVTRQKRLAQSIEWMAEGKRRNWKYEKC
ncbi:YdeI/OmpD-associated family protein [Undibacterium sp. LX40W]|uniref:YdeI/OmpD-associated family protein n=1 Tax=Undibacterium nitidum TaxID=2762298 RepID=A0A923HN43_9BURK|nr:MULTISPECIES: YdeI/OmpD-associated family protein [Undibacterium]MBC3882640.1 YdeI/OmpD-associated family protein [Undibacterium nitidum]MBC3892921.1 YdeI/OmpD-associated family protein [Undibacterium sp. LX40W]